MWGEDAVAREEEKIERSRASDFFHMTDASIIRFDAPKPSPPPKLLYLARQIADVRGRPHAIIACNGGRAGRAWGEEEAERNKSPEFTGPPCTQTVAVARRGWLGTNLP